MTKSQKGLLKGTKLNHKYDCYHTRFFNTFVRVGKKVYNYQACLVRKTEGLTPRESQGIDEPGYIDMVDVNNAGDDFGICKEVNAKLAGALGGWDALRELGPSLYNTKGV